MSSTIALFGMMGVGKTTVGTALAERLGRRLVDTDAEIVRWVGRSIPEIFATDGEATFRHYEATVVRELSTVPDLVLSLGGGTVLADGPVADLTLTGVLVLLDAPVEVLVERVGTGAGRPVLADRPGSAATGTADTGGTGVGGGNADAGAGDEVTAEQRGDTPDVAARMAEVFAARVGRYREVADVVVDATGSVDDVLESVIEWLRANRDVLTPSEYEAVLP